jgi:hypothetical protein
VSAEVITSQAHVVVVHPAVVVELGTGIIATCHNHIIATRLAELWNRYGLADVPDNAASLTDKESQ